MAGQSALLLGGTGGVGRHLLTELLSSPYFTRVGEYGRRVTPIDKLKSGTEKLEQKTIDFENLEEAGLKEGKWDVVLITLGTTRKAAGSVAAFERIDRDYVVNAARAAKSDDLGHLQRIVYLSSTSAHPNSRLLYSRSKGLTEVGLASLGYSDTIIFRPAFLKGDREGQEPKMSFLLQSVVDATSHIMGLDIQMPALAKSMRIAGQLGSSALPPAADASKVETDSPFTLIDNKGAIALAKENV